MCSIKGGVPRPERADSRLRGVFPCAHSGGTPPVVRHTDGRLQGTSRTQGGAPVALGSVLSAPSLVVATTLPPHPVQHQEESPPPPAHRFQVTSYSRRRKPPAQQTSTYCIAAAGWDEQPGRRAKSACQTPVCLKAAIGFHQEKTPRSLIRRRGIPPDGVEVGRCAACQRDQFGPRLSLALSFRFACAQGHRTDCTCRDCVCKILEASQPNGVRSHM